MKTLAKFRYILVLILALSLVATPLSQVFAGEREEERDRFFNRFDRRPFDEDRLFFPFLFLDDDFFFLRDDD